MKSNNKIILGAIAIVAVAGLGFVALSAKTSTGSSNTSAGNNSSSASNSTNSLNALDSAAIAGALAIARQTPTSADKTALSTFIASLNSAKNGNSSKFDLGVINNQLVDYQVDPVLGASAPICFVVKPPAVAKVSPYQAEWALYLDPGSTATKGSILVVQKGISTCSQAIALVAKTTASNRVIVTENSKALIKNAILSLPSTALTKSGLYLLDEARGLLNPAPSASPTK